MSQKIALITGVGPGTGSSLARCFHNAGYKIAMIARNKDRLKNLEDELENSKGFICDVRNLETIDNTVNEIINQFGYPEIFIHNAVRGIRGSFLDFTTKDLQSNFDTNVTALLRFSQLLCPNMIKNKKGSVIVTGNTSAHRGKADFGGTASTKSAQKILTESMARYLNPKGIHVAYITIDAAIDVPWTREMWPEKPDDYFINPDDIAREALHLVNQNKSAWTFDHWLRPFGEHW